ncbi:DUF4307 domain-containing protein [Streptomyces sp. XM4193]|uniref:DUF4307 domain-containing protein n=1 Tax=Streptomyces sp. XM4193 TaxID=2929782 RepID=UPI001FF85A99|nr:DUF4307 domain-containing protein [Streptomyces sp. XM4193]MCK1795680.1 DUF4307 domain-containing protein [Streptomyces sp. XM4193]
MAEPQVPLPAGRYGRSAADEERTDRRLKIVGACLGAAALALIGWIGFGHISKGSDVNAELIKFKVISDEEVQAQLEVHKDRDLTGVCTVRALAEDKGEVGRKDFTFEQRETRVDEVVSLRTTARASSAQLIGCRPAQGN